MNYQFSWEVIARSLPQIAAGILGTIELAPISISAGIGIGVVGEDPVRPERRVAPARCGPTSK